MRDYLGRRLEAEPSDARVGDFVARASSSLGGDASLPVFSSLADRAMLSRFLVVIGKRTPTQVARLGRRRWRRRAPLELPVNIAGVGDRGAAALERIAESAWLRESGPAAVVRPESVRLAGLGEVLRERTRDVLLADPRGARGALRAAANVSVASRPRLVVVVGTPEQRPGWLDRFEPPHGVAVVYASAADAASAATFTTDVLANVAADLPVHEAVRRAAEAPEVELADAPELIADPGTNEALSLEASRQLLTERAEAASGRLAGAGVAPEHLSRFLRDVGAHRYLDPPVGGAELRRYRLPELGRAATTVRRIEQAAGQSDIPLPQADPELIVRAQDRRVDLAVRANRRPIAAALAPGQRFRVLMRIGQPFRDSRLFGEVPPVAPSLPPEEGGEGHELEVVLYGLDFRVEGSNSRRLRLRRTGPTELVSIPVFAPAKPSEGEAARLRVSIYCRSYLVQSFLMTARVREDRRGEPPAFALEFAQSARFTNLDELPPRLASIAVNAGPSESHTLMVKGKGKPTAAALNDSFIKRGLEQFRTKLTQITDAVAEKGEPPSADPTTPGQFEVHWRELAWLGSKMHEEVFNRLGEDARDLLREIKAADGEHVIQIVRLDPSLAFPWGLLYDWPWPEWEEGADQPAFCFGSADPVRDEEDVPPRRCGHRPEDGVLCVYGFWAVRLLLEQLVPSVGEAADAPRELKGACPVRLGLGVEDPSTIDLPERLAALTKVTRMAGGAKLLDDLWRTDWRPSEIVAVGHHEGEDRAGPPGSRIRLDERWLVRKDLAQRVINRSAWERPNSIVLLLACATGATTPAELDDFAFAFLEARAAAVLATELAIFSDLAARCAVLMTRSLFVQQRSFATAVRELHRRLAHRGNPLAFSFTGLGHAGVNVVP